jgi:hypothetical protein
MYYKIDIYLTHILAPLWLSLNNNTIISTEFSNLIIDNACNNKNFHLFLCLYN